MGLNGNKHDELLRQLAEIEQLVRRVARRLDREAEALDDVVDALSRLQKALAAPAAVFPLKGAAVVPVLKLSEPPHAEPKAERLQIEWHADGAASARIDFGLWFKLPTALAELLELLAQDTREVDGGIVAWKTAHEIAESLTARARAGRRVSKKAVIQRIHRLRKSLVKLGIGDALIQTNRRKGWRFALVRKTVPPAASERQLVSALDRF